MASPTADGLSPNGSKLIFSPNVTTQNLLRTSSPASKIASKFSTKISPELILSPNSTVLYKDHPLSSARSNQQPGNELQQKDEPIPEIKTDREGEDRIPLFKDDDSSKNTLEDGRNSKSEFQKLLLIDMGTAIMAGIGGLLTVLAYDLEFDGRDERTLKSILALIFSSTLITIALNIFVHLQNIQYLKSKKILSQKDNIATSGRIWLILIETFILLLQPYPFIQGIKVDVSHIISTEKYYYYVNDFFSVLIALRVLFILRFLLNLTLYRSPRSQRLTGFYGTTNGYLFASRCLMGKNPFSVVTAALGIGIVLFGYMLRICERPLDRDSDFFMGYGSYWDSMWSMIVTITTVGYGDHYAQTIPGRIVVFIVCIWGTSVVSLVVVTLTNVLSMDAAQDKVLTVLERLELRKQLKSESAFILTNLMKVGINNRKIKDKEKLERENTVIFRKIRSHLNSFKKINREIKANSGAPNLTQIMNNHSEFVRDEIKEITDSQNKLMEDIERLKSLAIMFKQKELLQKKK